MKVDVQNLKESKDYEKLTDYFNPSSSLQQDVSIFYKKSGSIFCIGFNCPVRVAS